MKKLRQLLKSQHCKLVDINKEKTSFAFVLPDKRRMSTTLPKPADQMTEKELIEAIASSISGRINL